MRILIQRVENANVAVKTQIVASINRGFLVLLGIVNEDNNEDVDYLVQKIIKLRVFDDDNGIMNRSIADIDGEIIVVSQFTLLASSKKGNRPSYIRAATPEIAVPLYEKFIAELEDKFGKKVGRGMFGTDMKVGLVNDGPVTIWIDSKDKNY